jgi:hypothetical protein
LSEQQPQTQPVEDDPFAAPAEDPFAESSEQGAPPSEAPPPAAEAPAEPTPPAEAPPIVDREGAPVQGPLDTAPEDHEPPPQPDPTPDPDAGSQQPAQEAPQPPQEPQAPPPAAPEPPAAEAPQEEPAAPPPPPAPEPTPQPPADPAAQGTPDSNGDGGDEKKSTVRHYVVLYQTGPTTFEVAKLLDADGQPKHAVVVMDGQAYLEARNNEHAYKLAFHILGSPKEGATLWPIPKASYRPRRVQPAPPQPERERLTITAT